MSKKKQELKSHKDELEKLLLQFAGTLKKYFPDFNKYLSVLSDPRENKKCYYKLKDLLWLSLLLLINSSRNNYNQELRYFESIELLNKLFNLNLESIPHGDTLAYLWERLSVADLEKLIQTMVSTLIKGRYLDKFRFKNTYLVAFDGVEIYRWNKKHCDNCLYAKTKDGKYQYFHRVLEAKIVCSNGFSISIASEFIENIDKKEDDKQDCELKAFHRLADKVKKLFPKLPITLLADSLYPNEPVFKRCLKHNWNYIFVLKDTVLTSVWSDFNGLFELNETAIGAKIELPEFYENKNRYRWINNLFYHGLTVNVLQIASQDDHKTKRAFITNFNISEKSAKDIEENGQLRWKIENQGFDIQKHHGYNLEHTYSKHHNAMKVVYLLIQISHLIGQLFVKSDLLKACENLSLKSCLRKLIEAIHSGWSGSLELKWNMISKSKFQARFKPP